ncbi:hypothetical protein RRG08_042392 [Elysia crispata]|uniref:Uncharacterized protein n=1 Tax=Elysia crispata TaxID=231223 RepID=A0AAE0ZBW6_9GAST|nr:hypothetical protein RRG08_042392 [Elysia crispata]
MSGDLLPLCNNCWSRHYDFRTLKSCSALFLKWDSTTDNSATSVVSPHVHTLHRIPNSGCLYRHLGHTCSESTPTRTHTKFPTRATLTDNSATRVFPSRATHTDNSSTCVVSSHLHALTHSPNSGYPHRQLFHTCSESTLIRTHTEFPNRATLTDRFSHKCSESTRTRTHTEFPTRATLIDNSATRVVSPHVHALTQSSQLGLPSPTGSATNAVSPHVHALHRVPNSGYPHRQVQPQMQVSNSGYPHRQLGHTCSESTRTRTHTEFPTRATLTDRFSHKCSESTRTRTAQSSQLGLPSPTGSATNAPSQTLGEHDGFRRARFTQTSTSPLLFSSRHVRP